MQYACPCIFYPAAASTMSGESFVNNYQAPEVKIPGGIHATTGLADYDFNYCFDIKTLRSDRVELRPFLVSRTQARHLIVARRSYPISLCSMPNPCGGLSRRIQISSSGGATSHGRATTMSWSGPRRQHGSQR